MEKQEIISQLEKQRYLAMNGGNVVKRDAWLEIDRLLDAMRELEVMSFVVELEEI